MSYSTIIIRATPKALNVSAVLFTDLIKLLKMATFIAVLALLEHSLFKKL